MNKKVKYNWKYYNHALLPTTPPHVKVDENVLNSKLFWKSWNGLPILARWTSDWDCGCKTNWWYVIKDTRFDLDKLKSKRRYEIKKGCKNFYVEKIYNIQIEAYKEYPDKYRPCVNKDKIYESIKEWAVYEVYGVFSISDNELVGYALTQRNGICVNYVTHKVIPKYEKFAVNAALVHGILEDLKSFLENGGYICDGERSILHESNFQDYLEKYFGFRKAYCKLHIKYRYVSLKIIVKFLLLFKFFFYRTKQNKLIHKIVGLLRMQESI